MVNKLNRVNYAILMLLLILTAYIVNKIITSSDYYASLSLSGVLAVRLILWLVIFILMTPVVIARIKDAGIRVVFVLVFWLSYVANAEMVLLLKQFVEVHVIIERIHFWLSLPIALGALALLSCLVFMPSIKKI